MKTIYRPIKKGEKPDGIYTPYEGTEASEVKIVTIPDEEEIKQEAKNNADAIDRRGCSYWNGLFEGYQMGQRDLLSKLK